MIEITEETTFAQIHEYMRNELMTDTEMIDYIVKVYMSDPLAIFGMHYQTCDELDSYYNYLMNKIRNTYLC